MTRHPGDSEAKHVRRWPFFLAIWILFSLVSAAWSMGMPLAAGPDEPSHFVKAASAVRGEFLGTTSDRGSTFQVPAYVADVPNQPCAAYNPERTAACQPPAVESPGAMVDGITTAGSYNPVYYLIIGWPTLLFADQSGLYAMRIFSGIVSSAFLALGLMMLRGWSRRTIPIAGALIAITPMVLFINGVVNPSSLEITATFAAFVSLTSIIIEPRPILLTERSTILAIAGALACNTRSISPLWVAMALLIPLVLQSASGLAELLRKRVVQVGIGVVVLTAVGAFSWTLFSNALAMASPISAGVAHYDDVGASPVFGFFKMVTLSIDFGQQMIGILGWFDTVLPLAVYFLWSALLGALGIAAILTLRGRRAVFAVALLASLIVGPAVVQAIFIHSGGFIWQGRYSLPLFVCVVVGVAAATAITLPRLDERVLHRMTALVGVFWVVGQVLSYVQALRRYSVGASGSYMAIFTNPGWAPPVGSLVLLITATVSLSLIAYATLRTSPALAIERVQQ